MTDDSMRTLKVKGIVFVIGWRYQSGMLREIGQVNPANTTQV